MKNLDCDVYEIPKTEDGHVHSHAHILLPLTDDLNLHIAGTSYAISSNHLAFVPPDKYHLCVSSKDIIRINIPRHMIKQSDLAALEKHVCEPLTGLFIPLIELIKTEIVRNPHTDSLRYLYYYLYDKLAENWREKSLNYIHEHFSENITVVQLAEIENYNISYYSDWFKKHTGLSPSHYVRSVRIEKSKELLTTTNYRILDIALQVGYSDHASFTKAFKEVVGISPREYKKKFRDLIN